VLFDLADTVRLDMLRGRAGVSPGPPEIHALNLATGAREPLTRAEFDVLLHVPADGGVEADALGAELARRGLLISDETDDEHLARLRERAQALERDWNLYAASYHFMTRRAGMDLRTEPGYREGEPVSSEIRQEFVSTYGPSPPPFHTPAPGAPTVPLARVERGDGLYGALAARRTTRAFAVEAPMRRDDLSLILRYVFGAHGVAHTDLGVCIKRTSPSGGARHAVEAYPLIAGVEGVEPGLYHYDVRGHALTLLNSMAAGDVRATATSFACGQEYFGNAHVSFVLTARFTRAHWKYRRADKAYGALLVEVGHLSQTLYLIAAERGLGAFVTLAINSLDIERRLELDGCDEGVLALTGCGPRRPEPSALDARFTPLPG
jgi:putative peptide maturation dehydrogenase